MREWFEQYGVVTAVTLLMSGDSDVQAVVTYEDARAVARAVTACPSCTPGGAPGARSKGKRKRPKA